MNIYFAVYVDGPYKQIVCVTAENKEEAERILIDGGWEYPVRFEQMIFNNNLCVIFNGS